MLVVKPNITLHWLAKEGSANDINKNVELHNNNNIPADINNELLMNGHL